ncbi:hypothetical protein EV44_g3761 [Erysiphe necator]|uniref:Uncharacterized protein n=1 Tax=Uncinula necator TaxID=52586 RepID=A0A0B1P275_UNCNE|nr:hypothetical protein EV44_g3761 [Erysiphe necator]
MAAIVNGSFYPHIGIRVIFTSQAPVTGNSPVPVPVSMPMPIPVPVPIPMPMPMPMPMPVPVPVPIPIPVPGLVPIPVPGLVPVPAPGLAHVITQSISHGQALNTLPPATAAQPAPPANTSTSPNTADNFGIVDIHGNERVVVNNYF